MQEKGSWRLLPAGGRQTNILLHLSPYLPLLTNYMKRFLFPTVFAFLVFSSLTLKAQEIIKVACIGNSVTYGAGIEERNLTYPAQLKDLLGDGYEVRNFGQNGATLLEKGHRPYIHTQQYKDVINYQPDIAIIHLGLNDTDPRNWPNYQEDFVSDYYRLIAALKSTNPDVQVFICKMTPIFSGHPRFESGTRDWFWEIQSLIPRIAESQQVGLIDLHSPLYDRPDLFPDELHPNEEGAAIIASTVHSYLRGDYGGLSLAPVFGDHMVLQQKMPIPLYGTANAGEEVTVTLGEGTRTVTADAYGKWRVEFPPFKPGGPYQLKVSSANKTIQISDILVGEVWLAAGQSNMAFPLRSSPHSQKDIQQAQQNPSIRLLHMNPIAETGNIAWDKETLEKTNRLEFFSGNWKVADSLSVKDFSAVAFYFGNALYQQLEVPIGLIQLAVGGSNTESWIDRYTLEHHPQLGALHHQWKNSDYIMEWCRQRAGVNLENADKRKQRHPFEPSYIYEAGVKPLVGFPISGLIWYQGESNAHNVLLHEELFKTMVNSWRQQWGCEFPVYYTQLSSIERPSWPRFRDSQRKMLYQLKHVGMAVTHDVGDRHDVHPIQKMEVGERLAAWALAKTYRKDLPYSGPLFEHVDFTGKEAICSFLFDEGLSTNDGKALRGFELAGSDMVFVEAEARIEDNKVRVSSDKVAEPKYVRYAWEPFTTANLINKSGFPASTFTNFSFSDTTD